MSKLVLDTSAAYEIVLFRSKRVHFLEVMNGVDIVMAPDLFYSEAANVVWKMYRFEQKELETYELALRSAINMVDEFYGSELLWENAFKLACETEHTVYDCMYLWLALENQAGLISVDKKLNRKARELGITAWGI